MSTRDVGDSDLAKTPRVSKTADQPEEVPPGRVDNEDSGTPHNVSIYSDAGMSDALFKGKVFNGVETQTYRVHPLESGTYHFHCDIHPGMEGAFVVK